MIPGTYTRREPIPWRRMKHVHVVEEAEQGSRSPYRRSEYEAWRVIHSALEMETGVSWGEEGVRGRVYGLSGSN